MLRNLRCASILLAALAPNLQAWSWASECIGNETLSEFNFSTWPGASQLVNCPSRVYLLWTGGIISYFRGETAALNEAIAQFADVSMPTEVSSFERAMQPLAMEVPSHEVVLLPGPAIVKTFDGAEIALDWKLTISDAAFKAFARKESITRVFEDCPVMKVYVGGGNINLRDIQIPQNVSLVQLADLRARYLAGLKSVDPTVRGIAAGRLAALGASSAESIAPLAELLRDPEHWVQSSARLALRFMGKPARPILAKELERSDLKDEERKRLEEGIQFIDDTVVNTEAEALFYARVAEIDAFVARHYQAAHAARIQE